MLWCYKPQKDHLKVHFIMSLLDDININSLWKRFLKESKDSLQAIHELYPKGSLDEQGIPAYLNPNPLAQWLFWQRLKVCMREILKIRGTSCLDFGCGSGIMLPILSERFDHVIGIEIFCLGFVFRDIEKCKIHIFTVFGKIVNLLFEILQVPVQEA